MELAKNTEQSRAETTFRRAVTPGASLYALVDAARAHAESDQAKGVVVGIESLLAGPVGQKLGDVAPYLLAFDARSSFGQWWFEQWGHSMGVLLESSAALADLRTHFRTLLIVEGEDYQRYYFRFYDPRVLRVFLPNCTADEATRFFGPITAFYCESAEGKELLTYRPDRDGVSVNESPVVTSEVSAGPTGAGKVGPQHRGSRRR